MGAGEFDGDGVADLLDLIALVAGELVAGWKAVGGAEFMGLKHAHEDVYFSDFAPGGGLD